MDEKNKARFYVEVSQHHPSALENVYKAIKTGVQDEINKCMKQLNKNYKTENGMDTPLIYAIRNYLSSENSIETLKTLINHGVNVNEECNGEYPIHIACSLHYTNTEEGVKVRNLIEMLSSTKNIDVYKKDSQENTAFHIAAKSGNVAGINAIFATLKEKKMKLISLKNKEQKTPLQLAAIYGYINIMDILINNGCELQKEELLDIIRSNKVEDKPLKSEAEEELIQKETIPTDVNETSEKDVRKKKPDTMKEN